MQTTVQFALYLPTSPTQHPEFCRGAFYRVLSMDNGMVKVYNHHRDEEVFIDPTDFSIITGVEFDDPDKTIYINLNKQEVVSKGIHIPPSGIVLEEHQNMVEYTSQTGFDLSNAIQVLPDDW